jgi:hypothetical protein
MTVELVPPQGYLAFLKWTDPEVRNVECVHRAHFHHPRRGAVTAYAKLYPPSDSGSKGLANEIAGYLIAEACDLPRAPFAFVAAIPLEKLPVDSAPEWIVERVRRLQSQGKSSVLYPAFCAAPVDGAISAQVALGQRPSELLRKDILEWRDLARVLAFDDGIANVDRHFNNLLRVGRQRYVAIDHGCLVVSRGGWTADELDPNALYRNVLFKNLFEDSPPADIGSAALLEAERLAKALELARHDLQYWLRQVLSESDAESFETFFAKRLSNIEFLLRKRYNLLT